MDPFGLKKRKKEIEEALEQQQKELDDKRAKNDELQANLTLQLKECYKNLEELNRREQELELWAKKLEEKERAFIKRETEIASKEKDFAERASELVAKEKTVDELFAKLDNRAEEIENKAFSLDEREERLKTQQETLLANLADLETKTKELENREAALNFEEEEDFESVAEDNMGMAENEVPLDSEIKTTNSQEKNPLLGNIDMDIPESSKKKKVDEYKKIIQLPNGMVGKTYDLDLSELNLDDDMIIDQIIGLEEFELAYLKNDSRIYGTPTNPGEKSFKVIYRLESHGLEEFNDKKVRLLVNPDPQSLWKNLPPPEDGLYPKPNEAHDQLDFNKLKVVAASKRGRSHAHAGTFRDDHFLIKALEDDWLFVAVADGAGSAEYSREGSKIACESCCESVASKLAEQNHTLSELIANHIENPNNAALRKEIHTELYAIFGQGVIASRNAIVEKANEEGHQLRDYSTTLIFSLLKKFDTGYFIASYAVGDGAIVIHKEKEKVQPMIDPDGGEYAGQTRFLTMGEITEAENIWKRIRFDYSTDFTSIVLMTDGVSDPKFQTDANLLKLEMWDDLMMDIKGQVDFTAADCGEKLVDWLDFWSQGNHDDRTIAIIAKNN